MRPIVFLVLLVLAGSILAYVFLSPMYLGDFRWVIVALPVLLAIAREVYEYAPGHARAFDVARLLQSVIEPIEDDDADDDENDELDLDDSSRLVGLWSGTARIFPSRASETLKLLPLQLVIGTGGKSVEVLTGDNGGDERVSAAQILEYDSRYGNLDLLLVLDTPSQQRRHTAQLVLKGKRIVAEDETAPVTVELCRARRLTDPSL